MSTDEDTSIRVSLDTWQRLQARKDEPGKSFDTVIQELLDTVEGGTGGTLTEPERVDDNAVVGTDDGARDDQPLPNSPPDDHSALIDSVSASWDDDGRIPARRDAAAAALRLLFDRGELSRSDAVDELLPEYGVADQDEETWWRQNCRKVVKQVATYRKSRQAYVLDE